MGYPERGQAHFGRLMLVLVIAISGFICCW